MLKVMADVMIVIQGLPIMRSIGVNVVMIVMTVVFRIRPVAEASSLAMKAVAAVLLRVTMIMRVAVPGSIGMTMFMIVAIGWNRRIMLFAPGLEIEDGRPCGMSTSAVSAHQAVSSSSMVFVLSGSPFGSKIRRPAGAPWIERRGPTFRAASEGSCMVFDPGDVERRAAQSFAAASKQKAIASPRKAFRLPASHGAPARPRSGRWRRGRG
jgi:hypothetical protein